MCEGSVSEEVGEGFLEGLMWYGGGLKVSTKKDRCGLVFSC